MNLVAIAEADLEFTLEDSEDGFGVPIIFYDTSNEKQTVNCQTTDISFFIDPETGAGVSGRTAIVLARLSTLKEKNIPEPTKLTKIEFLTTAGVTYLSKVQLTDYDRKVGVVRLTLEAMKNV